MKLPSLIALVTIVSALTFIIMPAQAATHNIETYNNRINSNDDKSSDIRPLSLKEVRVLARSPYFIAPDTDEGALDIRKEALREAGISFGARSGLAWRSYEINAELDKRARYLDKIYNFRQLLIPAPSGMMIEPPVVSESINGLLIDSNGQQAAVSDKIYNIVNNARITSAARTWRSYLERNWGAVLPPPDILLPENSDERDVWIRLIEKGWVAGVAQADEIFQEDLNLLMADFQGMIRYRVLLAQGMISAPYALQVDRGITGGGNEMRIGDRAIQITGVSSLIIGSDQWQPASR